MKVACARPVMDQHGLSVAPERAGVTGHDDIGENS
jgi:hypothetical protein